MIKAAHPSWRSMPPSMVAMIGSFLLIPLWSLASLVSILAIGSQPLVYVCHFVATFWVVPICLAISLVRRHQVFVIFFLWDFAFLLIDIILAWDQAPIVVTVVRLFTLLMLLVTGLFLSRHDLLLNLSVASKGFWRSQVRFPVTVAARLRLDGQEKDVRTTLEDVSLAGLALAGSADDMTPLFAGRTKGQRGVLRVTRHAFDDEIPVELIWHLQHDEFLRAGFRPLSHEKMVELNRAVHERSRENKWIHWLAKRWLNPGVRNAAIVVVILATFGVTALPFFLMEAR